MEASLNEEPTAASSGGAPEVDDPLAAMEAKLASLEDRIEAQIPEEENDADHTTNAAPTAGTVAAINYNTMDNDDPVMAMFRMEEKIDNLSSRAGADGEQHDDGGSSAMDDTHDDSAHLNLKLEATDATAHTATVSVAIAHTETSGSALYPTAAGTTLLGTAATSNTHTGKRKRDRPSSTKPSSKQQHKQLNQNQDESLMNEYDKHHTHLDDANHKQITLKQKASPAGGAGVANTRATRINWAKSPHKERLHQILSDWFTQSGLALDENTGEFISDYKQYAKKVGISRTTLFKYIHKDPSKRKLLPGWALAYPTMNNTAGSTSSSTSAIARLNSGDDNVVGAKNRGKRRLIDEVGVRCIVDELKAKADAGKAGFSRQEATNLIMERFELTRTAASRQLSRHILPVMMSDGLTFAPDTPLDASRDKSTTVYHPSIVEGSEPMATILQQEVNQSTQQHQIKRSMAINQCQIKRSIVMSGVTTQFGQALFTYFYALGYTMAGCGRDAGLIKELQQQCPEAKLSVVDVTNDVAVSEWATEVVGTDQSSRIDLVIAADEANPERGSNDNCNKPLWEVPVGEFDSTIDVNIKGVASMIRHFVPRLISSSEEAAKEHNESGTDDGGDQEHPRVAGGTFVALSSNMGRTSHPYQASYCASKFAIEGMMKSVAMSLPDPLCAVPLAPGIIDENSMVGVDATQKPTWYTSDATGSKRDIDHWVNVAGPMILNLNRKHNGKSMSVRGFYTVRDRQSWVIQDGSGVA